MKCCGKSRSTPFCPQCGRKIKGADPLLSLLAYLRDMQRSQERSLDALHNKCANNEEPSEFLASSIANKERAVKKWQVWADAVEGIMANNHESHPVGELPPTPVVHEDVDGD